MNIDRRYIALYDTLIREPGLIRKYYVPLCLKRKSKVSAMIFMVDGRFPHGGMFDRLKGLVSVYAASKVLQRPFKLNFIYPFDLRKYLEPNLYNWAIDADEITYAFPASRPLFLYGEYQNPRRLVKKRNCEAHFYYGYNSLDYINEKFNTSFDWGTLYNELFKPTAYLQQYIDRYKDEIGSGYIVAHFRFMNLLGDKTEFDIDPTLPENEQKQLMERSKVELEKIIERHSGRRIMLACDSNNFTKYILREIPSLYVVPGEIRHIGTAHDTNDATNVKMFIDYYLIAGAEKVYNLVGKGMWKSAFPEYAAKIGGTAFERIMF